MGQSLDQQIRLLQKKLNKVSDIEVPRANAKALNNSARRIQTRVVIGVSKQEKIKQKHIRKRVFIKRATARKQIARFRVYRRDMTAFSLLNKNVAIKHAPRGTNRRGVRAAGRQFDHAFINRIRRNQRYQVFRRLGKPRMPIEVITISIAKTVDSVTARVSHRVMKNDYQGLVKHELQFRLKKFSQ